MVAGPPGVLFAFNGLTTGFDFFTIRYDDTSAIQTTDVSPIQGFSAELAYDPDGYLLTSYGDVVDVRDPLNPTHVGKFGFNGPVLPFPGPTALMVPEGILHKLDTTAFTEVASPPIICGGTPPSRTPRDVVHGGTGRIAYIADQGPLPLYSPTVCIVEDPTLIP